MLDWISNNLEAFLAIVALTITIGGSLISLWRQRKRITYRVHLDTLLGVLPEAGAGMIEGQVRDQRGIIVNDPSMVLVRFTNTGRATIKLDDFQNTPLALTFAGRRVVDANVIETNDALRTKLRQQDDWPPPDQTELQLPIAPLNRGDRIKVLVLLTGKPDTAVRHQVSAGGHVAGGKIVRDTARGSGPRARTVVIGGIALVAVGASAAVLLSSPPPPSSTNCVAGQAKLIGSSAFAPIAEEVMRSYTNSCASSKIDVQPSGSADAVIDLDLKGKTDEVVRTTHAAMSDGSVPGDYPNLFKHPIGIVAFTVVVNKATGLYALTADQIQGIYSGKYNNWNQIGGANLPISIVSRGAGSGTRAAFEKNVLKGSEPGRSSSDCEGPDKEPDSPVIRCEFDTTSALLDRVDKIRGAIGYSDIAATVKHTNVNRVKLDGQEPDIESAIKAGYPFWTVEYFYTYGEPSSDGLLGSLLDYMNSDTAKNILRRSNYVPCVDGPQDLKGSLCR